MAHLLRSWVGAVALAALKQSVGCTRHRMRWVTNGLGDLEAHCLLRDDCGPTRACYPIGHSQARTVARKPALVSQGGCGGDQLGQHGAEGVAG